MRTKWANWAQRAVPAGLAVLVATTLAVGLWILTRSLAFAFGWALAVTVVLAVLTVIAAGVHLPWARRRSRHQTHHEAQ